MLNEFISTILQILAFSLIPLIVYLVRNQKFQGFFEYIGLKPSNKKANMLALLVAVVFLIPAIGMTVFNEEFRQIMTDPSTITGKFKAMGWGVSSVIILLMVAIFKTAFAEELFFRGFLAKQLIRIMGYTMGNLGQAVLFGGLHVVIFLALTRDPIFLITIFLFVSLGAFLSAHLNEKEADGSIIPSWIAHGTANVVSYTVIGLMMM